MLGSSPPRQPRRCGNCFATSGGSASFWDALTTAISLVSQWLLNRKRLESWYVWIVVDVIYIPLYVYKDLYLTAILYARFPRDGDDGPAALAARRWRPKDVRCESPRSRAGGAHDARVRRRQVLPAAPRAQAPDRHRPAAGATGLSCCCRTTCARRSPASCARRGWRRSIPTAKSTSCRTSWRTTAGSGPSSPCAPRPGAGRRLQQRRLRPRVRRLHGLPARDGRPRPRAVPISGTRVRAAPLDHLDLLEPCVRAYFVRRVVLIGAESTGKTTLAAALAEHFATTWVPEYGREYWERKVAGPDAWTARCPAWTSDEFVAHRRRAAAARELAARTANRVLILRHQRVRHRHVARAVHGRRDARGRRDRRDATRRDLYLLTAPDFPFVQDGFRDGETIRDWMHARFLEQLENGDTPHLLIDGPFEKFASRSSCAGCR